MGGTLRIFQAAYYTGSILQLLTSPIHLLGHLQKPNPANDTERQLLDLLANYKTDFGAGFIRSMGDILSGLSLQYSIFILMIGLINLLALRQQSNARFLRNLSWLNFSFMMICSVNAYVYFFLPPLILFVLPAIAFLVAAITAPREG